MPTLIHRRVEAAPAGTNPKEDQNSIKFVYDCDKELMRQIAEAVRRQL